MHRPILKIMINLLLYCINVIDKNKDSANILFSCGERWEIVRIEETQLNVVGIREFFVGVRVWSIIFCFCQCVKYSRKMCYKCVKIFGRNVGATFSANKLCIYIFFIFINWVSSRSNEAVLLPLKRRVRATHERVTRPKSSNGLKKKKLTV